MNGQKVFNAVVTAILRSPLHGLIGPNAAVLTLRGRKSGRPVIVPVSVIQVGDALLIVSFKSRTWWRNLRGGAPISLRWKGSDHTATARVIEHDPGVADALLARVRAAPALARFYQITFDPTGAPDLESAARAASSRVVVEIQLE
jgi:deazaflavin-dependent oxidoreductase (nitroreductase family)